MRRFLMIVVVALLFCGCHSRKEAPVGPFDFRSTRWGMTQSEILDSEEDEPIYQSQNRLLYATTVIDKRVMLEYHLGGNRLYRARYILADHHIIDNKYVADYRDFQSVLTAKYGKPARNDSIWKKGASRREDLQPGVLVASGQLSLVSVWDTPDAVIVATLSGTEFKVQCVVTYTSKVFQALAQKNDATDPMLGGPGGQLGGAFENEQLEKATRDF